MDTKGLFSLSGHLEKLGEHGNPLQVLERTARKRPPSRASRPSRSDPLSRVNPPERHSCALNGEDRRQDPLVR